MKIDQINIENTFLNGDIEENIIFDIIDHENDILSSKAANMLEEMKAGNKVSALQKYLYGLRQLGRQWYRKLHEKLVSYGMSRCDSNSCVYTLKRGYATLLLAVYVTI